VTANREDRIQVGWELRQRLSEQALQARKAIKRPPGLEANSGKTPYTNHQVTRHVWRFGLACGSLGPYMGEWLEGRSRRGFGQVWLDYLARAWDRVMVVGEGSL